MEVLIIRHGQSQNNVIAEELKPKFVDHSTHHFDLEAFEKEWMVARMDDPPVSELGQRQAEVVGTALSPVINKVHESSKAKVQIQRFFVCLFD